MTRVLDVVVVIFYFVTAAILYITMIVPWLVALMLIAISRLIGNHPPMCSLNEFIRIITEGL